MTNHEYARLLLAQPEVPFYVSIQGESYYCPCAPRIEEGPDPIELASKLDEFADPYYKEVLKKLGSEEGYFSKYQETKEHQEFKHKYNLIETTLPIIKYAVVVI